jgi:hypothetical protein
MIHLSTTFEKETTGKRSRGLKQLHMRGFIFCILVNKYDHQVQVDAMCEEYWEVVQSLSRKTPL